MPTVRTPPPRRAAHTRWQGIPPRGTSNGPRRATSAPRRAGRHPAGGRHPRNRDHRLDGDRRPTGRTHRLAPRPPNVAVNVISYRHHRARDRRRLRRIPGRRQALLIPPKRSVPHGLAHRFQRCGRPCQDSSRSPITCHNGK
jgi:hypothetical protein